MRITKKKERATVHTRATPKMLAVLPMIEGQRTWLTGGGLSIAATQHNFSILREAFGTIEIEVGETKEVLDAFDQPSEYSFKTKPYPHQIEALKRMEDRAAFALFMEQGTGKTKVAIDRAGDLWSRGLITGVLVVAKKGVHRQWIESEVPAHFGGEWHGEFWPCRKMRLPDSVRTVGALKFFSINFDGAKTPKGKEACLEFVYHHKGRVLIVADETQEIKSHRSHRHKALEEIKKASCSPYRLALTGTPIAKDLTDEWSQLRWVNEDILGIRYISAFRNEYCIMGGFEGRVVIGHRNVERFKEKVDPHSFRATKDQLGILPKGYKRWTFDLHPKQKEAIKNIRKELEHQIDTGEIISAANAAVAMTKIQQASNGFMIDEDGEVHTLLPPDKNPRLLALMEYLEAYQGKTIIWARFRRDIAMIANALDEAGITFVEYHGGTSDNERAEGVKSFLDLGGARVFLSNPQAGGTGLNLQGLCSQAIYYSNSYNAVDRWQSEDRIHRIGTTGSVVYTDLVAKGSIDAAILTNLSRKKGISELALGDIKKMLEEM